MLTTLYIDVSTGNLLTALNNPTVVNPSTIPWPVGDTRLMQVYLLSPLQVQNPSINNYEIVSTAGKQFELFFDNGELSTSEGYEAYTQLINWNTDPNNQFFYGVLSLNTAALDTLLGIKTTAGCYLRSGYVDANGDTTVLSAQINVFPGIPNAVNVVPAGLTPLSLEAAKQIFVQVNGAAGAGFILQSPLGKHILLQAVDNGDGTARFDASPID